MFKENPAQRTVSNHFHTKCLNPNVACHPISSLARRYIFSMGTGAKQGVQLKPGYFCTAFQQKLARFLISLSFSQLQKGPGLCRDEILVQSLGPPHKRIRWPCPETLESCCQSRGNSWLDKPIVMTWYKCSFLCSRLWMVALSATPSNFMAKKEFKTPYFHIHTKTAY